MEEQPRGRTSEIQMVAQQVITQQARTCTVIMDGIKEDIKKLTKLVDELRATVTALGTDVTVLKTRWQLFAIAGAIVGIAGTLVGILVAIFK